MRFLDHVNYIVGLAGQAEGGEFANLVKTKLNMVYFRLLEVLEVPHEEREFTFASVADTSKYGMPLYVKEILNIEDPTNKKNIYSLSSRQFDVRFPGTTTTGTPYLCYPFGTHGVEKQPASTGVLGIKSSHVDDKNEEYKVVITGFDGNGDMVRESKSLNGTTEVNTTATFATVERIMTVQAGGNAFNGNITIEDSSDNELAVIPPWWNSPDFVWIEFYPTPSAAVTYTVRASMRKAPLVQDDDWPELPLVHHDALDSGVIMDLFPQLGLSDLAAIHAQLFSSKLDSISDQGGSEMLEMATSTFANVSNRSGFRDRPHRPLIQGVDFV